MARYGKMIHKYIVLYIVINSYNYFFQSLMGFPMISFGELWVTGVTRTAEAIASASTRGFANIKSHHFATEVSLPSRVKVSHPNALQWPCSAHPVL